MSQPVVWVKYDVQQYVSTRVWFTVLNSKNRVC
jgi:hypothetical protein